MLRPFLIVSVVLFSFPSAFTFSFPFPSPPAPPFAPLHAPLARPPAFLDPPLACPPESRCSARSYHAFSASCCQRADEQEVGPRAFFVLEIAIGLASLSVERRPGCTNHQDRRLLLPCILFPSLGQAWSWRSACFCEGRVIFHSSVLITAIDSQRCHHCCDCDCREGVIALVTSCCE